MLLFINMDEDILKSIIEITRHRDLDSLEYSLVATLAEIVPATEISIFKNFHTDKHQGIEEVLRLTILETDSVGSHFKWTDQSRVVTSDKLLEHCINNETSTTNKLNNGSFRVLIPIRNENSAVGAMSVFGSEAILSSIVLIKSIVKIYENYQIILNESEHDKLTGLFNRRTFDKKLGRLLKIQSDYNQDYIDAGHAEKRHAPNPDAYPWLVVLDFDGFKQINDNYGHVYGDEVLLILSQKMKQSFRKTDLLFRFGGDEFVIILEPVTYEQALEALEKFRKIVSSHDFPQIGKITISTGFAKIGIKDFPPAVLERADKALYHAKKNGRDCTFNYEALIDSGELQDNQARGAIDLF